MSTERSSLPVTGSHRDKKKLFLSWLVKQAVSVFRDPLTVEAVRERVTRAQEVMARPSVKWRGWQEVRAYIPSSEHGPKPLEFKIVVKTLDGKEKVITADEKDFHGTSVSKHRLKCTCQDAIYMASRAGRRLEKWMRIHGVTASASIQTVFSKYCLCKHVISVLAGAVAEGFLDVNDADLQKTLRIALGGIYLASARRVDDKIVAEIVRYLEERGETR